MIYQITIRGELDKSWSDWLGKARVACELDEENGMTTTLTLEVSDQPALFGILDRIRDMNLLLISVEQFDSEKTTY